MLNTFKDFYYLCEAREHVDYLNDRLAKYNKVAKSINKYKLDSIPDGIKYEYLGYGNFDSKTAEEFMYRWWKLLLSHQSVNSLKEFKENYKENEEKALIAFDGQVFDDSLTPEQVAETFRNVYNLLYPYFLSIITNFTNASGLSYNTKIHLHEDLRELTKENIQAQIKEISNIVPERAENVISTHLTDVMPILKKNARIEWYLDWLEYNMLVNQVGSDNAYKRDDGEYDVTNYPRRFGIYMVLNPIFNKIQDKFLKRGVDDPKNELVNWNKIKTIILESDNEEIETIYKQDSFNTPYRTPSDLIEIYNNRKFESNPELVERLKQIDNLDEDKTTLLYLFELINKSELADEDNAEQLDEALTIYEHAAGIEAVSSIRSALREADDFDEFIQKFYPIIDDVHERLRTSNGRVWISEDGNTCDSRLKDHVSHCGTDDAANEMWNLCEVFDYDSGEYLYGLVTAGVRSSALTQMHGYDNKKPDSMYNEDIVEFLEKYISEIDYSAAHMPEQCFDRNDLPYNLRGRVSDIEIAKTIEDLVAECEAAAESYEDLDVDFDTDYGKYVMNVSKDLNLPAFLWEVEDEIDIDIMVDINASTATFRKTYTISDDDEYMEYGETAKPDPSLVSYYLDDFTGMLDDLDFDEILESYTDAAEALDEPDRTISVIRDLVTGIRYEIEGEDIELIPYITLSNMETVPSEYDPNQEYNKNRGYGKQKELELFPDVAKYPTGSNFNINMVKKELESFLNDGDYLEKFIKGHRKVTNDDIEKYYQTYLSFESYVNKLTTVLESDGNKTEKPLFRIIGGPSLFSISIDFPRIDSEYNSPAKLKEKYSKYLRPMYTVYNKRSELTDYIIDILNSHPAFGDNVVVNKYTSSPERKAMTRDTIKQMGDLRRKQIDNEE